MKPEIYYYFRYQQELTQQQLIDICNGICKPYLPAGDLVVTWCPPQPWRERGGVDAIMPKAFYRRRNR